MFKKILVPIDFSDASKAALNYAVELTQGKKQIVLIHVFPAKIREMIAFHDVPERVKALEAEVEELRKKAASELEKITESLNERGIHAKYIFIEGEPAQTVVEESSKGYDLVVVGIPSKKTHVANTCYNIIKGVKTNCLVVKEEKAKFSLKKVLFAADFSEASKKAFNEFAIRFKKEFNVEMAVLNVFELYPLPYLEQGITWMLGDLEQVKKNLEKRLVSEYGAKDVSYHVIEGADAGIEIVDFAEKGKYNLIILTREEKDWMEKAFLGSVSAKVVRLAKIPVLIYQTNFKG
jgi:nucleotide-binding universal stress UspA family protein